MLITTRFLIDPSEPTQQPTSDVSSAALALVAATAGPNADVPAASSSSSSSSLDDSWFNEEVDELHEKLHQREVKLQQVKERWTC